MKSEKYIGFKQGDIYHDGYGNPLKCFECNSNKCTGSKSFSTPFSGTVSLLHCEEHEEAAKIEADIRSGRTTITNCNISGS